ncbi:MAG: deoxyhypusine synthase family protein [Euryarchaeota archaeon]|nr:deoxyhypusine synthase family protein [Euryarchaeota archaeon]
MVTREDLLKTPVEQIDLSKVGRVTDLVESWKRGSIQGRSLGKCASVYENMVQDPVRPTVIMGLSGCMIAGAQRFVIRDLIKEGLIDCLVSTGAQLYQDFYQAMGYQHYMGTPDADNVALHEHWIDRLYDTYVDELAFRKTDHFIAEMTENLPPGNYSSREFLHEMGRIAYERGDRGIMATCYELGVPMFSPALNDSSIGIGLTVYYKKMIESGKRESMVRIDPIRDNWELTQIKGKSPKTGIVYIGGGTPKNYINDVEVIAEETGFDVAGHEYGFQITVDAPHWGGLSGSTLEEAQSWGKIHAEADKATVYGDATIMLPLIAAHMLQKGLHKDRLRVKYTWDIDTLVSVEHVPIGAVRTVEAAAQAS